jgi:hypothetical protein
MGGQACGLPPPFSARRDAQQLVPVVKAGFKFASGWAEKLESATPDPDPWFSPTPPILDAQEVRVCNK